VRDIPRSTFAHQDEARFIPLSAGNGKLILLTYLRGPKGLNADTWALTEKIHWQLNITIVTSRRTEVRRSGMTGWPINHRLLLCCDWSSMHPMILCCLQLKIDQFVCHNVRQGLFSAIGGHNFSLFMQDLPERHRLSWNPTTSPWMKQLIWLRIVNSGDWCVHLALHTPSGACQKRSVMIYGHTLYVPDLALSACILYRSWRNSQQHAHVLIVMLYARQMVAQRKIPWTVVHLLQNQHHGEVLSHVYSCCRKNIWKWQNVV